MKIRILIASNDNGSIEQVVFTDDFDSPADDFFLGLDVSCDEVKECDLPHSFPLGYVLDRQ